MFKSICRTSIYLVLLFIYIKPTLADQEIVKGGGFGGNPKVGFYSYSQNKDERMALDILRDSEHGICYMQNANVVVKQWVANLNGPVIQFNCPTSSLIQGNLYWNGNSAQADIDFNDPQSRLFMLSNDALFYASMTNKMFQDWFGRAILLDKNNRPIQIIININPYDPENKDDLQNDGEWDTGQVTVGNGDGTNFYPFTTLTFIAHELAHGFTAENSNLGYMVEDRVNPQEEHNTCAGESKQFYETIALDESFSDMTAQALEFYLTGKNDWKFSAENTMLLGAMRYMDNPTYDCLQHWPGAPVGCSIDNIKDMDKFCSQVDPRMGMPDPHYLTGIFNKAFYLLSTAKNWDVEKAYKVMVLANQRYWKSDADFNSAACGVINATDQYDKEHNLDAELQADILLVKNVFAQVGIDTR